MNVARAPNPPRPAYAHAHAHAHAHAQNQPPQYAQYARAVGTQGRPPAQARCDPTDIRELLFTEMLKQGEGAVDSGGNTGLFGSAAAPAPVSPDDNSEIGISDKYFRFNSWEASSASLGAGELTFSLTERNFGFPVQNIMQIETGDFYFPVVASPAAYPSPYFFRRVTMNIKNISAQQSITSVAAQFRYHFEFDVVPSGIVQLLRPVVPLYTFTQPVRDLSEIVVQFRAPEQTLALPASDLQVTAVAGSSPATFALPPGSPLAAATAYALFFTGTSFTDAGSTAALLAREGGHMGTVNGGGTAFTLADAATALGAAETGTAAVRVGQHMFSFTLRFRVIEPARTNYITPV